MNKTKMISLTIIIGLLAFSSCKKNRKLESQDANNVVGVDNKYGVSIENHTLKFATFENYNALLRMPMEEKYKFYKFAENLPGFTSRDEYEHISVSQRPATTCNCLIDDEYINSIVNSDYIVIIQDFAVKLNSCEQKVYVSDKLAVNAADRDAALVNCDFTRTDFYVYTFQDVVEEELPILRAQLNHTTPAERCGEVAISDRSANMSSGTDPNGNKFPNFEVKYNNYGISGSIKAAMSAVQPNTNPGSWDFNFSDVYYKIRCGSITNTSGTWTKTLVSSAYKATIQSGGRLTNNPTSNAWKIRMRLIRSGPNGFTSYIQFLP